MGHSVTHTTWFGSIPPAKSARSATSLKSWISLAFCVSSQLVMGSTLQGFKPEDSGLSGVAKVKGKSATTAATAPSRNLVIEYIATLQENMSRICARISE